MRELLFPVRRSFVSLSCDRSLLHPSSLHDYAFPLFSCVIVSPSFSAQDFVPLCPRTNYHLSFPPPFLPFHVAVYAPPAVPTTHIPFRLDFNALPIFPSINSPRVVSTPAVEALLACLFLSMILTTLILFFSVSFTIWSPRLITNPCLTGTEQLQSPFPFFLFFSVSHVYLFLALIVDHPPLPAASGPFHSPPLDGPLRAPVVSRFAKQTLPPSYPDFNLASCLMAANFRALPPLY